MKTKLMAMFFAASAMLGAWADLGGNGTKAAPYEIGNYADLVAFAAKVNGGETNAWAVLTADITATGATWTPIGNWNQKYSGNFDGRNHAIANLSNASVSPVPDYSGLFGVVESNGVVRNVKMVNATIYGCNRVGGIAGNCRNGATIVNCRMAGSVTGASSTSDSIVGGIVGACYQGVVEACESSAMVTGDYYAGGIAGANYPGTVKNCSNIGEVVSTSLENSDYVGGIVGYNSFGSVENCFNTGTVKSQGTESPAYAGGVIGLNECGIVENCYNTGAVTSATAAPGSIVGMNRSYDDFNVHVKVSHSYGLDSVAGGVTVGAEEDTSEIVDVRTLSAEAFKDKANFVDWDFETVWYMGASGPLLRAFGVPHDKVQLWKDGPYWATTNIGAEKPEDYGYYFWWGDTIGYKREGDAWVATDRSSSNFEFYNNPISMSTCKAAATLRNDGWIITKDDENYLVPEHDAAHVQWGGDWRMPTGQEIDELHEQCEWTWTTTNGVNGYIVRGRGDYASSCIFIPAAGYGDESLLSEVGISDGFWSSVTYWHASTSDSDSYYSKYLGFDYSYHSTASFYRYYGRPVRPVCTPAASGAKFAASSVRASESGTVKLTVCGGSLTGPSSVKVFLAYQTAAAADLDFANATVNGVKVKGGLKFPLTLSWDTGDTSPVTIEIPVKADKSVEDGETFTFQIADVIGTEMDETLECTVTLDDPGYAELAEKIKDGTATKAESNTWTKASHDGIPYMRGLAYPADGGKATGSGYCPAGKKVTLKASANKGWKFLGWRQGTGKGELGTGNGFVAETASLVIDRSAKPAANSKTSTTLTDVTESTTFYAVFAGDPRVTATPVAFDEEKGLFVASDGGKVTGAGRYAPGKKVTLKATANKGYAFSRWEKAGNGEQGTGNGLTQSASYAFEMPDEDVDLYAVFVTVEADKGSIKAGLNGGGLPKPTEGEPVSLETNVMAGVYLEWPIAADALSQTTVKVAGLPSGLKFTAKDIVDSKTKQVTVPANTIYGAPTAASKVDKKKGVVPSDVKITVTTAGKSSITYLVKLTVDPLPAWVVGTFDGEVGNGELGTGNGLPTEALAKVGELGTGNGELGTGNGELGTGNGERGTVALTVAANGKISGKLLEDGKTWTLSASNFSRVERADRVEESDVFYATVIGKAGKEVVTNEVAVRRDGDIAPYQGVVSGVMVGEPSLSWTAWQNLWKRADTKAAQPVFKKNIDLEYYPLGIAGDPLKIAFKKDGAVSFSGKIGGVSVSGSAQLVWNGKNWQVTFYAPPKPTAKPPFASWCETFPVKLTVDEQNVVTKVHLVGANQDKVQLWDGGPYWATTNIGAEYPWESGWYFWWGDTVGYRREGNAWVAMDGTSSDFEFYNSPTSKQTWHKDVSTLQNEGWVAMDGDTVLTPEHDAAQVQWGGAWRMPTDKDYDHLGCMCNWSWTTRHGVKGYVVRGKGDYASASIFLPASGAGSEGSLVDVGTGNYWSSVPYWNDEGAHGLRFESNFYWGGSAHRPYGFSIRPVQDAE